ncbi:MAG: hypothetical protein AAGG81_06785 [Chlamydiota bacterium]
MIIQYKNILRSIALGVISFLAINAQAAGQINQTSNTTPILSQDSLPYTITLEETPFILPSGLHSGAAGTYKGQWVIIGGRTNGLHGFGIDPFPPKQQNTDVYVIDIDKQMTYSRSLADASSGLSQEQIDQLSVTSPQYSQVGNTLYICGGYGVDTATNEFGTKTTLTAVNLPKLIKWVKRGKGSVACAIRQTNHPWMQVTGGFMTIDNNHLQGLLIFGQNFDGVYTPSSNGQYTEQVRNFQIIDTGKELTVQPRKSEESMAPYRRRDLNVVPMIKKGKPGYVALSGVFTLAGGIWTVPVTVSFDGSTNMKDPNNPNTFKQGMNNYASATAQLYSKSHKTNYILLLGGLSYGYFDNGTFMTDEEVPFINQVTTVKIDRHCEFSQYIMEAEYPVILSQGTNPGNRLIFGTSAYFFNNEKVDDLVNGIINFDKIKGPTTIGFVVGGIMSTLPNTSSQSDSTASPYIFRLVINPKDSL